MTKSLLEKIAELDMAIAAQETMRGKLDEAVLETILSTLQAQRATLEQQMAAHQQRRMVTVLFADVSGYTAMSERMDAEEVTHLMNRIWERLDRVILTGGGEIDKHLGDGVMALWGADEAREDNPERAVQAALAIKPAVVIPMHHLEADPQVFRQKLESLAADMRVLCLNTGEELRLG